MFLRPETLPDANTPPFIPGLVIGTELCWLAPPVAGFPFP
jgi:hypothetical protein